MRNDQEVLSHDWKNNPRWKGSKRNYTADAVCRLRPSIHVEHSLARIGADKFWKLLQASDHTVALGSLSGAQAVNMVRGGLKAIYLSGWQVAADANTSHHTYPDQSLYPVNSVPTLVKRIQNALLRADQVERSEGHSSRDWFVPILADAEAGFGGPVHAFELMKQMIEAGAGAVHFEDQLASEKKCGHMGGKVLVPTSHFIRTLSAARLASDVCGIPTVLVARTDSLAARLMTYNCDEYDREFLTGEKSPEGYHYVHAGINSAIARGLAYAPYADVLWMETSTPDIKEAQAFAEGVHRHYPGKPLTYNCSPSFNWNKNLSPASIASFQRDLSQLGYKFQFVTLAGWHLLNYYSYDLASKFAEQGMSAYADLQAAEFASAETGYTAVRHQKEVGTAYFDKVLNTLSGSMELSTGAMKHSTEEEQFSTSYASLSI
jgi:isocitrate lyase